MSKQKTIQRATARLAYLRDLSLNENTIKRNKVDKSDGLVRRMISRLGE